MIYVSDRQLKQVQYLIHQSSQGIHHLFEPDTLAKVYAAPSKPDAYLSVDQAYDVEAHIERLILLPSLSEKKSYFDSLDLETQGCVVRTYINIVENHLYESDAVRH